MATTTVPSKKKRTKGGRYSHEITREEIELYYHLPCEEASRQLGIGLTILKRICRRLGIDKWPYRQLKRAGKLGEVAAASAAQLASGGGPAPASGGPPTLQSPQAGGSAPATAAKPAAAPRKRAPARKKVGAWEPPADSSTQEEEEDDDTTSHNASSSGSEGSWHAAHRAPAPAPGPAASEEDADVWAAAGLPETHQGAESLPPAAANGRRRASLELGVTARGGGGAAGVRAGSPPQRSGEGGADARHSHHASGALKRIREEEADALMNALDAYTGADQPQISPFSAVAALPLDGFWSKSVGAAPAGYGALSRHESGGAGADQLTAGLSRLAMRTLSLKRHRSREGTAIDALDQALLMERMEAQPDLMGRSCSMPSREAGHSPPLPRGSQLAAGGRQPQQRTASAALAAAGQQQQGSWMLQDQLCMLPPGGRPSAQTLQQAPLVLQQQLARAMGRTLPDCFEEGGEGEGPLPIGDPNLSGLLFNCPTPASLKAFPASSELASEGCMLPERGTASAAAAAAAAAASAGALPGSCDSGAPGQQRQHASISSARLAAGQHAALGQLPALEAAAITPRLPPEQQDPSGIYAFDQQLLGPAAGVTSVGLSTARGGGAAEGIADSCGDLPLSPFTLPSAGQEDHEVDDLLADFLSPAPSNQAEGRMLELLGSLSPRISAMDDPTLAGLARTPRAPSAPGHSMAMRPSIQALRNSGGGGGGDGGHLSGHLSSAMLAAARLSDPLSAPNMCGSVQGSPLTPPMGNGGGSGSIASHDSPTSSGTGAMTMMGALPAGMPAGASSAQFPLFLAELTNGTTDLMPLVARLAQHPDPAKQLMAGQLMQLQAQQAQHALRHDQAQQAQQAMASAGWPPSASSLDQQQQAQQTQQQQQQLSSAGGDEELHQAVAQHQAVASQYLQQRQEVQAMLAQRGSSQHLGALAGDQDRLQQLARLKQLKQQLAGAQARQQALRRQREEQRYAALAELSPQQQGQQSQGSQAYLQQQQQPSMLSDVNSAFHSGMGLRLGPPPPLPALGAHRTGAGAGAPAASSSQPPASPGDCLSGMHAMLAQWRAEAEAAEPSPMHSSKWAAAQLAAAWSTPPGAPQQAQQAYQAQMQPRTLPARASSSPMPWDLDWAAMA